MEMKLVGGPFDGEVREVDTGYTPYALILTILNTENNSAIRLLYKHTQENEYKYTTDLTTDDERTLRFMQTYIEYKNRTEGI